MSPAASRDDLRRVEQSLTGQVQRLEQVVTDHARAHEREKSARLSSRRWLIGIAIAVIAAVDGPMVDVLLHLH